MPVPICFVNPKRYDDCDGIDFMFNKPGHGLSPSQLVDAFSGLLQAGLIEAFRDKAALTFTSDQIAVALEETGPIRITEESSAFNPLCTYYRLTSRGGELWERFAAPDWERYVKTEIDEEAQSIVLTSRTPWRIDSLFQDMKLILYEMDSTFGYTELLGAWEATYWKVLPNGYRTYLRWEKEIPLDPGHNLRWLAFCGYCQHRDGWYGWR